MWGFQTNQANKLNFFYKNGNITKKQVSKISTAVGEAEFRRSPAALKCLSVGTAKSTETAK